MRITILAQGGMLSFFINKESSYWLRHYCSPFGIRDNGVIGSECGARSFGCRVVFGDPALVDN